MSSTTCDRLADPARTPSSIDAGRLTAAGRRGVRLRTLAVTPVTRAPPTTSSWVPRALEIGLAASARKISSFLGTRSVSSSHRRRGSNSERAPDSQCEPAPQPP